MSYRVTLTRKAEKEVALLSNPDYARVSDAIGSLTADPRPAGSRKLKGYEDDWRIKVGKLRILYSVDDDERLIAVYRVTYRKEAYRGI